MIELLAKVSGIIYNRHKSKGYDKSRGDFIVLTYAEEARTRVVPIQSPLGQIEL